MIEISAHGAGISPSALEPFLDKEYRDSYLDAYVRANIAYQIQAIRERMGLSQADFGQLIEKPQNVVSRLEDTEYSGSVKTLIEIAQHLGIGLEIRFRSYPDILQSDVSSAAYRVDAIGESFKNARIAHSVWSSVHNIANRPIVASHSVQTTATNSLFGGVYFGETAVAAYAIANNQLMANQESVSWQTSVPALPLRAFPELETRSLGISIPTSLPEGWDRSTYP